MGDDGGHKLKRGVAQTCGDQGSSMLGKIRKVVPIVRNFDTTKHKKNYRENLDLIQGTIANARSNVSLFSLKNTRSQHTEKENIAKEEGSLEHSSST